MTQKKSETQGPQKKASASAASAQGGTRQHLRGGLALLGVVVSGVAALAVSSSGTSNSGGAAVENRSAAGSGEAWNVPSAGSADTIAAAAQAAGVDMTLNETELPGVETVPWTISQSPRIYLFENLLSHGECEFLKRLAMDRLRPAGVVTQTEDKHTIQTQSRNNEQIWLTPQEEGSIPLLKHVLKRLHRVAHMPDTDAEALQIGRYSPGQKYESHVDTDPSHDVERPVTLLVYLSDVEAGGDTLFPLSKRAECSSRWHTDADGREVFGCAKCCETHVPGTIRVRPKQGNAVLFFNHGPDGQIDRLSEHAACPVRAGAKWIAQRWFRVQPYQNLRAHRDPRFDGVPAVASSGIWDGRIRELHRKAPRVFLFEGLLSAEECAHLVDMAGRLPKPVASGGLEQWRISEETERDDPVLVAISKRLRTAAYMPEAHTEALHLARQTGDVPSPMLHDAEAESERVATLLIFLTDAQGGETVFPSSRCRSVEECCRSKKALRVPPRRGSAVLIYLRDTGSRARDKTASYGACAVREGAKWMAQRWFRASRTRDVDSASLAEGVPSSLETVSA